MNVEKCSLPKTDKIIPPFWKLPPFNIEATHI